MPDFASQTSPSDGEPATRSLDSSQVAEQSKDTRRGAERNVVAYFGIVIVEGGDPVKVELVDLSAQGARMVAPPDFEPADKIVLKIPETGACFLSEVAWRNGATFGIKFMSPLPKA